ASFLEPRVETIQLHRERVRRGAMQETDDRPRALLRACRERPRSRRTEQRDEVAPPHQSITSSICASSDGEIVSPSASAVFMLSTTWNLVGCSTGRSAGLAPLISLST